MIWIDSLILTDRGQVKLRDVTPSHRAVTPRGYVPVHEVLAPDHADVRELPVIVFLTARSRSAKTSVVVSPDHLLSVVHPDWDRPRLVRADEVRDTYDLVTLTRYQSSALLPIRGIEHAAAPLGNIYLSDPLQGTPTTTYTLIAANAVVGVDNSEENLTLLRRCASQLQGHPGPQELSDVRAA